jgi:predicted phosphoribosyltransferase
MGTLRIISRSQEVFPDRIEAGRLLSIELAAYRGRKPVVLGIPRGGIVVAKELASALEGELDVVLAHKLGTPGQPELAMGSVAEDGKVFLNEDVTGPLGVNSAAIEREKVRQLALIRMRIEMIRKVRPKVPLEGRVVIVTDDGVATGATTQAALWAARGEGPETLVCAVPVGPEDTIRRLSGVVDEMLCLRAPPMFAAVGQFYDRFSPVEDDEMLAILSDEAKRSQTA